jgi:hypothetical protein
MIISQEWIYKIKIMNKTTLIKNLIKLLNELDDSYMVIGSTALSCVIPDFKLPEQQDLDLLIKNSSEITSIIQVSFMDEVKVKTTNSGYSWNFNNEVLIDFLFSDPFNFDYGFLNPLVLEKSVLFGVDVENLRVINPYNLFILKFLSPRDKDREDLQSIYKMCALDTEHLLKSAKSNLIREDYEDFVQELEIIKLISKS